MKHSILTLPFAVLALGIPAAALAAVAVGDQVGTTDNEIRAALGAQGYTVTEIEREDGEIEVEYTVDGQEFEMSVALDTGLVTEIEADDDD